MISAGTGYAKYLGLGGGAVLVWGSLGFGFVVVFARWMTLFRQHDLGDALGEVDWSFGDSWATTVTGVGALLGTILATTGILSDKAEPLSNAAFAGLNLLFAAVAALAPLLFSAFQKVAPQAHDDRAPGYQGFVGTFLIACIFTLWAAVGEIATIVLLLREIQAGFLSGSLTWLFLGMLVAAVLAILVYSWIRIRATVEFKKQAVAFDATAPLPRWNLL